MSLFSRRGLWVAGAVLALLLAAVAPVGAAEPTTVELEAEPEVALGDMVTVRIALRDAKGGTVGGATILLLTPASFGTTSGEMRLGQVITNGRGQATFTYRTTRGGQQALIARFAGNDKHAPAQASVTLNVRGSAQLYEQQAGVRVPGIGVWILVLLLGAFWSVYLVVMVLVTLIAREGKRVPGPLGGNRG